MRRILSSVFVLHLLAALPLTAEDSKPAPSKDPPRQKVDVRVGTSWTMEIKDRTERGTLQDAFQFVRGDSGRWSDEPQVLLAPSIAAKPEKMSLDDWFDQLAEKKFQPSGGDEVWLLLRTKQLDDNDRAWVERVERRGDRFTIVVSLAKWQGKYSKNFTCYHVYGVSLGRLEPGKYEAKCIVDPLVFHQFDGNGRPRENDPKSGRPRDNGSKDETPAAAEPIQLPKQFVVSQ